MSLAGVVITARVIAYQLPYSSVYKSHPNFSLDFLVSGHIEIFGFLVDVYKRHVCFWFSFLDPKGVSCTRVDTVTLIRSSPTRLSPLSLSLSLLSPSLSLSLSLSLLPLSLSLCLSLSVSLCLSLTSLSLTLSLSVSVSLHPSLSLIPCLSPTSVYPTILSVHPSSFGEGGTDKNSEWIRTACSMGRGLQILPNKGHTPLLNPPALDPKTILAFPDRWWNGQHYSSKQNTHHPAVPAVLTGPPHPPPGTSHGSLPAG